MLVDSISYLGLSWATSISEWSMAQKLLLYLLIQLHSQEAKVFQKKKIHQDLFILGDSKKTHSQIITVIGFATGAYVTRSLRKAWLQTRLSFSLIHHTLKHSLHLWRQPSPKGNRRLGDTQLLWRYQKACKTRGRKIPEPFYSKKLLLPWWANEH
jgi:hypothetical protein